MTNEGGKLTRYDYHVAWICPLPDIEFTPARILIDTEHERPEYDSNYDDNNYVFGSMGGHNVVFATLPPGTTGNVNASHLVGPMFKTFPNIKMAVLVGIGGGIPLVKPASDPLKDVHLGDVVVGWSQDSTKFVTRYYESGRTLPDGKFQIAGYPTKPDWSLIQALGLLQSNHSFEKTKFNDFREKLLSHTTLGERFLHPGVENDRLFRADVQHNGDYGDKCDACLRTPDDLVVRPERTSEHIAQLVFHLGGIATGNSVIQDGQRRDEIGKLCDGALCIEMELAGVETHRPCLVIRGISDYSDSHKNDVWKSYAAGNAAVFARELLGTIKPSTVISMEESRGQRVYEFLQRRCKGHSEIRRSRVDRVNEEWRNNAFESLLQNDIQKWFQSARHSRVLWIHDITGAGHSLLSSKVIDLARASGTVDHDAKTPFVAYCFCENEDSQPSSLRSKACDVLATLAFGLLVDMRRRNYIPRKLQECDEIVDSFEISDSIFDVLAKVLEIIIQSCLKAKESQVFLIIDGLSDKLSAVDSEADILNILQYVQSTTQAFEGLRWLFTTGHSEPEPLGYISKVSRLEKINLAPSQVAEALQLDSVAQQLMQTGTELCQRHYNVSQSQESSNNNEDPIDWFYHCTAGRSWLDASSRCDQNSDLIWYRRSTSSPFEPSRIGLGLSRHRSENANTLGCYFSFASIFYERTSLSAAIEYEHLHPCQALWCLFAMLVASSCKENVENYATLLLSFTSETRQDLRTVCSELTSGDMLDKLKTRHVRSHLWHVKMRKIVARHLACIANFFFAFSGIQSDRSLRHLLVIDSLELAPAKDCSEFLNALKRISSHFRILLCLNPEPDQHPRGYSEWRVHMPPISFNENSECEECLDALRVEETCHKVEPLEGTHEWVWNNNDFKTWDRDGGILWIHGKPGCGKSILATTIERVLQGRLTSPSKICSWFHASSESSKSGSAEENIEMLRSVIYQVLSANRKWFADIKPVYREYLSVVNGHQTSFSQAMLQNILFELSRISCEQPIILLIDGIGRSEAAAEEGRAVLKTLYDLCHSPGQMRVILLSRHNPDIEKVLGNCPKITMHLENKADVRRLVQHRLSELRQSLEFKAANVSHESASTLISYSDFPGNQENSDALGELETILCRDSSGIIPWAQQILEALEVKMQDWKSVTEQDIKDFASALPTDFEGLREIYDSSFTRLLINKEEDQSTTKATFTWLIGSRTIGNLQLPQLREAIALSRFNITEKYSSQLMKQRRISPGQVDDGEPDWDEFRSIILKCCGPLVEFVRPNSNLNSKHSESDNIKPALSSSNWTAQFMHQTVVDFLQDEQRSGSWFIDAESAKRGIRSMSYAYLGIGNPKETISKLSSKPNKTAYRGGFGSISGAFDKILCSPIKLLAVEKYQKLRPLASFAIAAVDQLDSFNFSMVEELESVQDGLPAEDCLVTYCIADLLFAPLAHGTNLRPIIRYCCSHGRKDILKKAFHMANDLKSKYETLHINKRGLVKGRDLEILQGAIETLDAVKEKYHECYQEIAVTLQSLYKKHTLPVNNRIYAESPPQPPTWDRSLQNLDRICRARPARPGEKHYCWEYCLSWEFPHRFWGGEKVGGTRSKIVIKTLNEVIRWLNDDTDFKPFSATKMLRKARPETTTAEPLGQFRPVHAPRSPSPPPRRTRARSPTLTVATTYNGNLDPMRNFSRGMQP